MHHELVDCLGFNSFSCSVPAGDARGEGTVVAGMTSAFHHRQVRLAGLLVSIVRSPSRVVCQNKIKKDLTSRIEWDIKGY